MHYFACVSGLDREVAVAAPDRRPPTVVPSDAPPDAKQGLSRWTSSLFLASVVVALVPIVVATARAIARDWLPIGDNAFFAIRARDVLTTDPPLLGTWTSASLSTGTSFNNPGPLLFDVLALPTRLLPDGAGLALGAALLNGSAVIGIAVLAYRRGGAVLATAAMTVAAALCWAMGSELLFDPWQPHSLLLPFLFFLVLVWSITCGDVVALPLAAAVGSLVVQSHLSYAFLVAGLGAWAVLGLVLELRRRRREDPGAFPGLRRRAVWAVAAASLVFAACWAQPLVEQFTGDGKGNLSRLAEGTGDPAETIGYDLGARVVATVVTLPPWWFRSSFGDAYLPSGSVPSVGFVASGAPDAPSLGIAVASLALLGAVLAWCAWDARRRRDRVAGRAIATAGVALLAGLATAGRIPVGAFGIAPHQFRWLWPLAAFAFFAILATLARRLGRGPARSAPLVGAAALATVVIAALNLPTNNQRAGPSADDWSIPAARELGDQLGELEDEGALLFDVRDIRAFDPYTTAVMAELQRRGISFTVDDPGMVRQLGPARRFTGRNAESVLVLKTGNATRDPPAGARRVALREGLTERGQRELSELRAEIGEYVRQHGRLSVSRRGREEFEHGRFPTMRRYVSGEAVDPEALFASRDLVVMVRAGLVAVGDPWARRFERYADLQLRSDRETVALFLRPLGDEQTAPRR
jgi:hypothetical protein